MRLKWLVLALACLLACARQAPPPRVLVLGLDGCDPLLLSRLIQEKKLPNFARLQAMGGLWPLQTTMPAQSPVAWATFLTGQDPGGHGLFDFLQRDPSRLQPVTSMSEVEKGRYRQTLGAPPFWTYLNVPATLLRVPVWFPAAPDQAHTLTGLGTPDLLGGYGTFSYYSEEPQRALSGGTWVTVEAHQGEVAASLIGPEGQACPLHLSLDLEHQQALVEVDQSEPFLLKKGEWSQWIPVVFPKNHGMVRFLLRSTHPLGLYVSPLNDDPQQPTLPLSNPSSLAAHLARLCGRFYTQGMAEDSKALSANVLNDQEYLQQSQEVLAENERLLDQGLREFTRGLFFFYVGHIDLQSHLYWRQPAEVEKAYLQVDRLIGRVLQEVDQDTTLWVLSDHGFAPFERVFDLNAWLQQQGYLALEPDQPLEKADWSKTRAYALGFNGLYLNLRGREAHGTLTPEQAQTLKQELRTKLRGVLDPKSRRPVVREVYESSKIYSPKWRERAPDLVVGYEKGYRVSWEAALGQRSRQVLRDNLDHWSGDHLIDSQLVPGVLLCSRPIRRTQPALQDLAPTILKQFRVQPPATMRGRDLLEE
ncbi:hypothetical protein ABS71_06770 [bacterium SCN 62-11]|nr:alkaline phosphatase family protein [Candidatus Eremiobacteraeota bacterium]ODT73683.1 MAG: hypothetical protein ABS71_06770 [bacterium SCN 62-11]